MTVQSVAPSLAHRHRRGPIVYLSGCTNPLTKDAAFEQPRLGALAQPGNAIHRQAPLFSRWGLDNGVFGKARRGVVWTEQDTADYLAYLRKVVREVDVHNALFATAPDVLRWVDGGPRGDAVLSWAQSREVFPQIRSLGLPAAFVAQDGMSLTSPRGREWDEFDVLFLGGSDHFKLGPEGAHLTREARLRGKWVHMGRVNSLKRLLYAASIGCDSADGTFIGFGPRKNTPIVLSWLEATGQMARAAA